MEVKLKRAAMTVPIQLMIIDDVGIDCKKCRRQVVGCNSGTSAYLRLHGLPLLEGGVEVVFVGAGMPSRREYPALASLNCAAAAGDHSICGQGLRKPSARRRWLLMAVPVCSVCLKGGTCKDCASGHSQGFIADLAHEQRALVYLPDPNDLKCKCQSSWQPVTEVRAC